MSDGGGWIPAQDLLHLGLSPSFPWVSEMPGPEPEIDNAGAPTPEVVLRCVSLVKRYGEVTAVAGLDLEVRRGECLGLLGPNGAGKTTTVEIMEGLLDQDGGRVEVLGQPWPRPGSAADRRLRARIGVALQETKLSERLTVLETVTLFASLYPRSRAPEEVVELLGLGEKRKVQLGKLSGGQRQRVALACGLVSEPEVLFLDEPTTGLDPQARRRIWEVVQGYLADGGTVLLTTHYMEEAERLCDRVAIMDKGRIVALDSPLALVASLGAGQVITFEPGGEAGPELFQDLPGVAGSDSRNGRHTLRVTSVAEALPALLGRLSELGLELRYLSTHEASLEDVFVHLTGRELRDG
jgi:ABC-2 type transport system ATP-binding protein